MTYQTLAAAYVATRARLHAIGYPVAPAYVLKQVRAGMARGQTYFSGPDCPKLGARSDRGGRWASRPEAVGLRFIGFADDLCPHGVKHTGWHTDSHGDGSLVRGAVYQLPGHAGEARFVAAIRVGSGRRDWSDDVDGALVFLDTIYHERADDVALSDYDSVRSAAYAADREAELYADDEREYQDAWQAGSEYAEKLQNAAVEREKARDLMREAKKARIAAGGAFPVVYAAIRVNIRNSLIAACRERQQADELRDQYTYGREVVPAFAEGAGE